MPVCHPRASAAGRRTTHRSGKGIDLALQRGQHLRAVLNPLPVPMFVAGDEVCRTQRGNNNTYCQDNQTSWFDWTLVDRNRDLHRFWKRMIEFRKRHAVLRQRQFFTGAVNQRGLMDVAWHGTVLGAPGWSDPDARALAMTLAGFHGDPDLHAMLNMHWDSLEFELPAVPGRRWFIAVDTAQTPPYDIADRGAEPAVAGSTCTVQPRSVVVLVNRVGNSQP